MSRNQTLVIDVKVLHTKEMSYDEFLKFCQDEEGLNIAEATKRWDRIFKTYSDGMFEVDDMNSDDVGGLDTSNACEGLCEERIKCLVEEFNDESEAAKEAGEAAAAERIAKSTTYYPRDADEFLPADEDCEDFFAGKMKPFEKSSFEFPV